jgi:hypothetical protein
MNLYSSTRETFRRLIDRHRTARTPEKRAYVFVFVLLDFRNGSEAKRSDVVDDGANDQQPNHELMWTWFLPNPLSPSKEEK